MARNSRILHMQMEWMNERMDTVIGCESYHLTSLKKKCRADSWIDLKSKITVLVVWKFTIALVHYMTNKEEK